MAVRRLSWCNFSIGGMDDLTLQLQSIAGFDTGDVVPGSINTKKRRPPNAFLLFCIEYRAKMRDEHPERANVDISRLLGDMWNELSEKERAPYHDRARAGQEEFKRMYPNYRYDRAKSRRLSRKNSDFDPKQRIEFPDIMTLLSLSADELRNYIHRCRDQLLMCDHGYGEQPAENDTVFQHGMEENFGQDVFHSGH